ncbi:MAG TPA: methylated-DNA--[protein]-cysteine S-methyltransferase [Caulobacteraceae bacterium]|nr:methylated-DNA--[protein]-cysteine S-methyltransferase [Caulobacteraceae bacterium]
MGQPVHQYLVFETPGGFCAIGWSEAGVTRFVLPAPGAGAAERSFRRRLPGAQPGAPPRDVLEAVAAVKRYFQGAVVDFSDLRVDLEGQDELFRQIYAATRRVGWGRTTTYGALAKEVGGGPETARDVGQAMAKNPVPLIIPCHRVLAAGGKVGGFSAPGGAATKVRMLEMEGVRVAPPPPAQLSLGL